MDGDEDDDDDNNNNNDDDDGDEEGCGCGCDVHFQVTDETVVYPSLPTICGKLRRRDKS